MTISQEDALYEFLENVTEPFSPEDVVAHIRKKSPHRTGRLVLEITSLINSRNIAFRLNTKKWLSRRGCFETVPFVISPTRLELLNGILIPGHRCIPFANPALLPQEYTFYWKGAPLSFTTSEGSPEEFYPYYSVFGEEYAPQYVARDNPENEAAYNCDPYEDPPEVSIQTLDMRNLYRETAFVPGDRFVVRTLNWKIGMFELERVGGDAWPEADLDAWAKAAENGFAESFAVLGPGSSTEEQIAYAYWYGGKRMRDIPAFALEDFLYEKTEGVETVGYGIETRFWYAGKEIPDRKEIEESRILPDRTMIEELLLQKKIPISEYVVQSYARDAFFRNDLDLPRMMRRIVPPSISMTKREWDFLAEYALEVLEEYHQTYSLFLDKSMGPIRQRVGELHTAVINLTARLHKGEIDTAWLPKHTFIILSQIQEHAASVMEDLDIDDSPPEAELEILDNSVDSMIETYGDIKEMIDEALDSFRQNNLSVVRPHREETGSTLDIQLSISGINVWRRIIIPETYRLSDLHRAIQGAFEWRGRYEYRFTVHTDSVNHPDALDTGLDLNLNVHELSTQGTTEIFYHYGAKWTVTIMLLSPSDVRRKKSLHCVAGAGAAPPEDIDGPLRFKKYLTTLTRGSLAERQGALRILGQDFDPDFFDIEACNRSLQNNERTN
ncbi:MAG: plasmid pRiA4b ORF-3 family protein [Treponema sp.]|jgi:hypothetical protein|nr:plasmid pRiA4b ORF-3 family protein [Treponema sp.]